MMNSIDFDKENPFDPGKLVSSDFFVGREDTINKILRYINKSINGSPQYFFLAGNQRMGKTSLAKYIKEYVETEYNMIGIYISITSDDTCEYLIKRITELMYYKIPKKSLKNKIKSWFGSNIDSIEIKGNKINFDTKEIIEESHKEGFQELFKVCNGVLIIIDEINEIEKSKEFIDCFNKLVNRISISAGRLPLFLLPIGYPENFDNLVCQKESLGSIFKYGYIDRLNDKEVREFFKNILKQQEIKIDEKALDIMVTFSSGSPLMMQQIGESVYWAIDDNHISKETAKHGVIDAANEIEYKQVRPIFNKLSSDDYNILYVIGQEKLITFKKTEIKQHLENVKDEVISNFLDKMIKLDILEYTSFKDKDIYKFKNILFYSYFLIKSNEDFK